MMRAFAHRQGCFHHDILPTVNNICNCVGDPNYSLNFVIRLSIATLFRPLFGDY